MKRSIYQKQKNEELKKKASILYAQGLTTREVGKAIGRSHEWVAQVVKILESTANVPVDNSVDSPINKALDKI